MNKYELWFISANISNKSKIKLINAYNSEENIYNNIKSLDSKAIIKNNEYSKLRDCKLEDVEKLHKYLSDNNIEYITINSDKYPENLKEIYDPPYVLFYKGDITLLQNKNIAIIGARCNTIYGEVITKRIINELSNTECGTVSGVAYGIDSIAHREAILKNVKTIGVLGCGIDIVYPKSNKDLYSDISQKGLLISEFLPRTKPFAYNFPRRNRIISGLSYGVIIIEAAEKSGSLITANYAIDQGKDVMAVPGSILNKSSSGCNQLIRDGAKMFIEDLDLYEFVNEVKKNNENINDNSFKIAINSALEQGPTHLNEIIKCVNVDRKVIFELLFEMQNRNEIICLPGNYYARIN